MHVAKALGSIFYTTYSMLPYRERTRLTEEGTTRTAGQITQIGSKASQIARGELRWMEDYLGKKRKLVSL